ncbi:hypothetical protein V8E53_003207 [Lactarius tabidus]
MPPDITTPTEPDTTWTPPHRGPHRVTIPTTAASIEAGQLVLTTEGSEVKKWQQWMQESQQMPTMPGPIKRTAEMLEWIGYQRKQWGLSMGPLLFPIDIISEKPMGANCHNAQAQAHYLLLRYQRKPWSLNIISEKPMGAQ